jgi:DHA3 family tetracycline resistance protein-like MFS transporter
MPLSLDSPDRAAGIVSNVLFRRIDADPINQLTIIIVVEAVNFSTVSMVAVLGLLDALQIWHMAVAAGILGIAAAFFFPAYSAILPRILPAEQLLAANGVEGVVRPVFQRSVGPAVAGMVIGATMPPVGALVVAVLFGLGLALLVATRSQVNSAAVQLDPERPHALRDLRDGFAFMVRTPWLLWTLLFASIFVLVVLGPIEVLLPFIAQDRFTDGARSYGFILAFFGFGSALGALTVSSRRMPRRYLTTMMAMWGLGSVPLVIVGITSSFPLMATATFAIGVTDGAAMVIWGTLLQRRVPREMLGRVSSLDFFVSLAFLPLSFAIVGPLSKVVSMQTIFLVAGVVPVLVATLAVLAARMPRDELAHPLR